MTDGSVHCLDCKQKIFKALDQIRADMVDLKLQVRMETQQSKDDWNDAFSRLATLESWIGTDRRP